MLVLPSIWPVTCHTDYVGKGSTFVAIKGSMHDGVSFIRQAIAKGATTIIAQVDADIPQDLLTHIQTAGVRLEFAANARRALALRSAQAWGNPAAQLKIIAITGTKGKTTTSWLLHHMLHEAGYKVALLSTVKNKIGMEEFPTQLTTQHPDYLHAFFHACVIADIEYVVMEVAAQAISLHRIAGLAFDGIIFTNFSPAHGEFYVTEHDYFNAKRALFDYAKADAPIIINADDAAGSTLLAQFSHATAYSIQVPSAQVFFDATCTVSEGTKGICHMRESALDIHCPALIGTFNASNCAAAITMAWRCGLSPESICAGMKTFSGVPGRLEKYTLPNEAIVIIDYAHNPLSFRALFPLLRSLTHHLIIVAGAGGDRDRAMRPVMGELMSAYADQIFLTSDNPRSENPADIVLAMYAGVLPEKKDTVICELDRKKAIEMACALSQKGSIIALLGKGPDEYEIVGTTKFPFSERHIIQELSNR